MKHLPLCALLALSLWAPCGPALPARAQATVFAVDAARSTLAYTGHHPAHSWTGTSREVSGALTLDPGAPAQARIEVRVPVQSFDSGNATRDAKMLRLVEAASYPAVTFVSEAVVVEAWTKTETGYAGAWRVRGRLTFHGQTHPVEIPATVRIEGGQLKAEGTFSVSLKQFQIDRPRLLFVPVKEFIDLEGTIRAVLPVTTADH